MKIGISDSDLRKYAEMRLDSHRETCGTVLEGGSIAVLDERSITDSTVIFHQFHYKELWEEGERWVVRPAEVTDNDDFWFKWRIPFNKAWTFYIGVSNIRVADDMIPMFSDPQYLSPDGVVDVGTAMEDHGY